MSDQNTQKYYGNEAFETIYERTKQDYAPQLATYTPLDEQTLTERISAVLRPLYDRAVAAIFRNNQRSDAELDADAISRGMGSSTFVTDVKRRQDRAAADDVKDLESEYGVKLADQLYKAMEGERSRMLEVEQFNAQQQNAAAKQAFAMAKYLYAAYLEARAAQGYGGSGGSGTANVKKEEKLTEAQVKSSLAQAVAAARGQIEADPNGAAFYAKGDPELADRVTNSDLPKYVKMRAQMNGTYTADQLNRFRQMNAK